MLLDKVDIMIIVDLIIANSEKHHSDSQCMLDMDLALINKVKLLDTKHTSISDVKKAS